MGDSTVTVECPECGEEELFNRLKTDFGPKVRVRENCGACGYIDETFIH
jgi:uncharacterized Zn finger protein